uniref:Centrosome and spindle pole-associated protein 1 C-terminal domain-containing protein n=1 Tax=Arion vulgaris TaxID=1028688 RepID=A0A0B7A6I1_9EUPU
MNVDASGWLDPEKRPDRLKPLGGEGFMTNRSERDSKVKPYHTLFLYGNTDATSGRYQPNDSVHQAYNFYATRDIDRPAGYGSLIQPLVVPYVDNRPIIMPGRYETSEYHPKYNPFEHNNNSNNDSLQRDIRALLGLSQMDRERTKIQMAKENDDYQRRMRNELKEERRRLMDQEDEARRRMEHMRRELEERRREWERQLRDAQRAKSEAKEVKPKTAPITIRPPSTTLLKDMDETRRRLIDERKIIEELLRAQKQPEYTEVKVLKRPPPPPTPPESDFANRKTLEEFNYLKNIDAETRKTFRRMYPELPETNIKLEAQQRALLRQQEEALRSLSKGSQPPPQPQPVALNVNRRPRWLDTNLTPLPHRVRQKDRLYTAHSLDGDLDRIYSRTQRREQAIASLTNTGDDYEFDKLRLRSNRPASAETLTDDTWMRPASASVV